MVYMDGIHFCKMECYNDGKGSNKSIFDLVSRTMKYMKIQNMIYALRDNQIVHISKIEIISSKSID